MKGVIFNLAEHVVSDAHGADTWDTILDRAGLDGAYTSLGNYPDEELYRLIAEAAALLDLDPQDVVRTIAHGALPLLAQRYPAFFAPHTSTRPFLLTLNDIIHPEVRKLYPGADVPVFGFEQPGADVLLLEYRSGRRLCALAEGFVLGAADHYRQTVAIVQSSCMLDGAESCLLHCTFAPAAA